jgi:hypothetical protein
MEDGIETLENLVEYRMAGPKQGISLTRFGKI